MNDIQYCEVQPLDPESRATTLGDYKKFCVAGTFNDTSDAFNYMYQYHLQAAKVVDHRLHVNNKRRADETEAEAVISPTTPGAWILLLSGTKKQNSV